MACIPRRRFEKVKEEEENGYAAYSKSFIPQPSNGSLGLDN
jgi:hypothetical protein